MVPESPPPMATGQGHFWDKLCKGQSTAQAGRSRKQLVPKNNRQVTLEWASRVHLTVTSTPHSASTPFSETLANQPSSLLWIQD